MACRRRIRGRAGLVILAGALFACGSQDGSIEPATTGASAGAVEAACPADESPAVTAFEAKSGDLRWTYCSGELGYRSMIGASDDLAFVATMPPTPNGVPAGDGPSLVALDAETGAEQWRTGLGPSYFRFPTGPFRGSGVIVGVLANEGGLMADVVGLDPATGATVWSVSGSSGDYAATDELVVGTGGNIVAYDRSTGEQRWSVPAFGGHPVITDDRVIVFSDPGAFALDLGTGAELWRTDATPAGVAAGLLDGVLVYSGQDDPASGVDVETGETLWTQPGVSVYDDVFAIGDGAIYVFSNPADGTPGEAAIVAYEGATGETRWRHGLGERGGQWPFFANDEYVVALWPNVLVLSTDDGSERWSTPVLMGENPRYSGVAVNDRTVFVASSTEASGGD